MRFQGIVNYFYQRRFIELLKQERYSEALETAKKIEPAERREEIIFGEGPRY